MFLMCNYLVSHLGNVPPEVEDAKLTRIFEVLIHNPDSNSYSFFAVFW